MTDGSDYPANAALRLLPERLLRLPLTDLGLTSAAIALAHENGAETVGDLLPADPTKEHDWLNETTIDAIRRGLDSLLVRGLPEPSTTRPFDPLDWPSLQGHLLLPLDDDQRALLRAVTGLDEPPVSLVHYARVASMDLRAATELAERTRAQLHERSRELLPRLRDEIMREIETFDGVVDPLKIACGSMLATMAEANGDPAFPMRLAAFCLPTEVHLRQGYLVGMSPSGLNRLIDQLRAAIARRQLPVPLTEIAAEVQGGRDVPTGLLTHLLRKELRLSFEIREEGEVIVPDPRSPATRLAEILDEDRAAMRLNDLVFAYRDRYRRANPRHLEQILRSNDTFVVVGPDLFALRQWHEDEFEAAEAVADRAARWIVAEDGKQDVLKWLRDDGCTDTTAWLVMDVLRRDERVRLLGRGEACPATERRSQVMVKLLADFRRASGDVVESLFVENQPDDRRRLVQRLLDENRLFVRPEPDRVDTLTNYPFNEERLRRTQTLVQKVLDDRGGYAPTDVVKKEVDQTDLGGTWLTPMLLEDLIRRHGWFDVLPGNVIALRDRKLAARLTWLARQELREAGVQLTVDEILRQRTDLAEFADCLAGLLHADPLVHSQDGKRFCLV